MRESKARAVYVRVTALEHERLTRLALRQDRKVSQVIHRLIREHLREQFGPPEAMALEREAVPA